MSAVRVCSDFIDLHMAVLLSQYHLLKKLSFPYCMFLPPLSKLDPFNEYLEEELWNVLEEVIYVMLLTC